MDINQGLVALSAALAVAVSAIATAKAEAAIGTAGVGAFTEKPELFGKALVMLVIPETIIILGFVISILLIFMMGGH